MTVEVATTIATLDSALPAATDPKSEGDDHIRLIKTVLKANVVSGPASSTDNTIPRFDGTTGKLLQGSGVVVDDSNNVTATGQIYAAGGRGVTKGFALPDWRMYNGESGNTLVFNNGTDRMTLDTSGNLLVNATAPDASWGKQVKVDDLYYPAFVLKATGAFGRSYILGLDDTPSAASTLKLRDANSGRDVFVFEPSAASFLFKSGAFGYGAGAGGTVTQVTSKATTVTLNKPSGRITMHNAALGAGAVVTFSVLNSFVTATDTVSVCVTGGYTTITDYAVSAVCLAGEFGVVLRNTSGVSRSDALQLQFTVIKGSTT